MYLRVNKLRRQFNLNKTIELGDELLMALKSIYIKDFNKVNQ